MAGGKSLSMGTAQLELFKGHFYTFKFTFLIPNTQMKPTVA